MASLQGILRSFASMRGEGAREVVADTNRQICKLTETNRFVTLFFGIYDDSRRELVCVNAGHNPPILLRAGSDGASAERLGPGGTVLGLFPQAEWKQRALRLEAGDLLVAFTDGVSEAPNPREEEFGDLRLEDVVARHRHLPLPALCETILSEVSRFLEGKPAPDDLTLLVLRGLPSGAARSGGRA